MSGAAAVSRAAAARAAAAADPVPGGLAAHVVAGAGGFRLTAALAVAPGEVVAVLGPNGAGKTTLLRALAGLSPLTDGRVTLAGAVVEDTAGGVRVPAHRRAVGMVFADGRLFGHLSARENVAFGPRSTGAGRRAARAAADAWLARLDLGGLAGRRPGQLSGGQAQRVALARALARDPELLLLDEPLSALDAETRDRVREVLRAQLAAFAGPTVLVTHDLVDALTLADRVVVLEDGAVVQDASPAGLVAAPATRYVARLVGTNLLPATSDGSTLRLAGPEQWSLPVSSERRGAVLATFPPGAVAVAPDRDTLPTAGPADGWWPAVVAGLEHRGDRLRVTVAGDPGLSADVDLAAAAGLDLARGAPLLVRVDPAAVTVHPAASDGPGVVPGDR